MISALVSRSRTWVSGKYGPACRQRLGLSRILALSVVAMAFFPFVAELLLGLFFPQPLSELEIYTRHPRLPVYTLLPNAASVISTGETNWSAYTDENGLRIGPGGRQPSDPTKDEIQILVLGGTNTFGYGVDYEKTFAGLLDHGGFQVINAAVPKYGPVQYRQLLEDFAARDLRPDVILVGFCPGTDFGHVLFSKDLFPRDGVLSPDGPWKSAIKRHSHLYRLAAKLYHRAFTGRDPVLMSYESRYYDPAAWDCEPLLTARESVRTEMRTIKQLALAMDASLVFVLLPTAAMLGPAEQRGAANRAETHSLPGRHTRELLCDLGIEFIDTTNRLAELPPGTTHHTFDRHPTHRAHQVVFSELNRRLGRDAAKADRLAPVVVTGRLTGAP